MKHTRLSLILLAVAALSGCSIELHHGLNEQNANDIYVLLTSNNISASKVKEEGGNEPTYMIVVPKQDAAAAAQLLKEYSLPRPMAGGLQAVVNGKGMVPTATEERAMLLNGLAGDITNALNKIDGVLEARAIVMLPEKNDLSQPDRKPMPTASVLVKYRLSQEGRPPLDETQIRRFVASAVGEDLKPENVTVVMSQAAPTSAMRSDTINTPIFGISVAQKDATKFRLAAVGVALLVVLMAFFTLYQMVRGSPAPARPRR